MSAALVARVGRGWLSGINRLPLRYREALKGRGEHPAPVVPVYYFRGWFRYGSETASRRLDQARELATAKSQFGPGSR
ncbi:hypothetical protein Saa2_08995 [Streptomyces acidiscabies]|nr:hypothetical protein Saa2_08995 [Streptomyces acidiscabies]